MVKICLMASHGYPPGPGLVFCQQQSKVIKDFPPYLSSQGARQEVTRLNSLNLSRRQHEEPWRPISETYESIQLAKVDSTIRTPLLIDMQDARPCSVLFSFGIAEQCARHEKILQFLMSGSSDLERGELDLSVLSDLMGLQAPKVDIHRQPGAPLIYPSGKFVEFDVPKPLVDFVGEMVQDSKITVHPDGRVLLTGSGTEIKDILSIVSEFYFSKNSSNWRKQSMLIPQFSRVDTIEAHASVLGSSLKVTDVAAAPLKSPEKVQLKPSPKKKTAKKGGRERDLYRRNHLHACESLLSLMMDKKRNRKTVAQSLKKSGPELPELLAQFSTGIAGTGLAVVFSVICKLACGRGVPFCASKAFSTILGLGLVWLSWSVNRLRNTVVYFSKNSSKSGPKDEEMMKSVDKDLNEIYFRAATLMAVTLLKFA